MLREGILLVRLKSMGDILFTLPAVHAVREAVPGAPILFVVSKEYSALLQGFTEVTSVIELDRGQFRGLHPIKIFKESLQLLVQMRRARPGLAIDFQGYGETALLVRASGATERWGTVYRPGRRWAYTRAIRRDSLVHPASDHLAMLHRNGLSGSQVRNQFILPKQAGAEAAEFLASHGLTLDRPLLFIQPFTSAPQKNWPLDRYAEVAGRWRSWGWQILFGGGPADRAALEPVRAAGYPVAAGAPLLLSAALVNASTLVLGGDTGLLHLAVAMGKRVVMVMRSLRPGSTHPFQHKDWAVGPQAEGLIESITTPTVNAHCLQACSELGIAPQGAQGDRA